MTLLPFFGLRRFQLKVIIRTQTSRRPEISSLLHFISICYTLTEVLPSDTIIACLNVIFEQILAQCITTNRTLNEEKNLDIIILFSRGVNFQIFNLHDVFLAVETGSEQLSGWIRILVRNSYQGESGYWFEMVIRVYLEISSELI